ncbi:hypothetical protein, partial [Vibrio jasicida]|uniref:hypothetical protein n=1 Tax=Vibrio jasicida TaxID=766224 RepID=UPI00391C4E70
LLHATNRGSTQAIPNHLFFIWYSFYFMSIFYAKIKGENSFKATGWLVITTAFLFFGEEIPNALDKTKPLRLSAALLF